MRDYKFRAWDKKRKRMYTIMSLHTATVMNGGIWATVEGRDVIEGKNIHIQVQPKDIEVMQYTGLKDKNGKEIYEGDIVKGKRYVAFQKEYVRFIGEVVFVNVSYRVNGIGKYIGYNYEELNGLYEVMGNLYESPAEVTP